MVSFRAIDKDGLECSSFNNLNEIVQLWCYAQELDTMEHAFMNVVTSLCGRVRWPFLSTTILPLIMTMSFQDVNVDLEDDVSHRPLISSNEDSHIHISPDTAHRTPGNTLSTLQAEHRFPFGSPTSERELRGINFLGSCLIFF